MFRDKDLKKIESKGITPEMIEDQLNIFKNGFPFLRVASAASINNGIVRLTPNEETECEYSWEDYLIAGGSVEKFVPASGAASRMFKNLFEFISSGKTIPETKFEKEFFDKIEHFAFYDALNIVCKKRSGLTIPELKSDCHFVEIVRLLILPEGLNYGNCPKGTLQFHKSGNTVHTALEEHLEEGAQYAKNAKNEVKVHFTVSPDHRALFNKIIDNNKLLLEAKFGVKYSVTMSEQKSSTDTIAVEMNNEPFIDEDGSLLFRPAGHGALIENLNDIDANVVFIKNIDNVVPNSRREITIKYKKVIGGYLVTLQKQIEKYTRQLERGNYTMQDVRDIIFFLHNKLNIRNADTKHLDDSELVIYLLGKLKRPIRVCGVVKNDGEPGGGPYIAYNEDGTTSPQILESSQFDANDPASKEIINGASHFNPVDLVCYIKDIDGNKYDLPKYVDKNTGFISEKSKNGRSLKALELPGLWNGAMSDWNTVFVEVPIETFNPVKTVNDLLRREHQG
ncbi:MAG: DUF4301 family protein [Muribaculaceae bacterium]